MAFVQSKPLLLGLLALLAGLTITVAAISTASAAKPVDKIEWSNGFPSGEHLTLNIHGKHDDYQCSSESGGGSVFVPEYGDSQIQMVQNKKSSVSELTVHDKCAEAFDGDPAVVQMPKGTYQMYARILAKPKKEGEDRQVSFYPELVEACNHTGDIDGDGDVDINDLLLADISGDGTLGDLVDGFSEHDLNQDGLVNGDDVALFEALIAGEESEFGSFIDCTNTSLVGLGIVTGTDAFLQDGQELERQKGKSKGVNITEMFMYTGIVYDSSLDLNDDDVFDIADFELADLNGGDAGLGDHDLNTDGVVNELDFEIWVDQLELAGLVIDYRNNPTWVFDLADLVVYGWDYKNNGSKLVQVRMYPVENIQ